MWWNAIRALVRSAIPAFLLLMPPMHALAQDGRGGSNVAVSPKCIVPYNSSPFIFGVVRGPRAPSV